MEIRPSMYNESRPRKSFFIISSIVVIIAAFALGVFFGFSKRPAIEQITGITSKEPEIDKAQEVDFSPFWAAWKIVEERYAGSEKVDRQKMIWGAIQGAVSSVGDPYTTFFPPEEKKLFESEIKGNFEGVGMEIGIKKGMLTVVAPLKDTPAFRAGIKPGDKILKIGDKETIDMTTDEAVRLIRGEGGTKIKLIILSADSEKPREVELTREVIKIPVLDTEQKSDGIFVIKLYNFSSDSTNEFRKALRQFTDSGSNKLILDLRSNPGGFLDAAVDISSWFLDMSKIVVREHFKDGREELYRSKGYPISRFPMVVLVNNGSASASEIVAGALQDQGAAKLVGEKTFGKGSVQELVSVTDDTSLKVTIARWLTPKGTDISKNGLTPDFEVKNTEDAEAEGRDLQFEKALEVLKNWK
ncbi:S41 family peptidase [Candidatus Giovannonibacteria bacterium]|nr:S41 family peptidase [Candidatus Giovannonibacteria bacterium]